jgi:hypothetical protein
MSPVCSSPGMPDPVTSPKPPVIVAAEEPFEEEVAAPDPPAAEAPSEVDETDGARFPDWALIPSWKPPAGFPAGRAIYFVPLDVRMMAKRTGGQPIKLKDGSTRTCRQLILWELNLGDEKAAFLRAGGDPNRAAGELAKQMIRAVDGEPVTWADLKSPAHPDRIWADLGPRYRNLLSRFYTSLHVLAEAEVNDFFYNCVEQRKAV